jgi:hypothetical protein
VGVLSWDPEKGKGKEQKRKSDSKENKTAKKEQTA